MKSKTFEEAKKYFENNKDQLLDKMYEKFNFNVDYQSEFNQVAVWAEGFSICYQNGDMNGNFKGQPIWDNDGANCGLDELKEILTDDDDFNPLIATEEYWENEYLNDFINFFCEDFATKNNIDKYFD